MKLFQIVDPDRSYFGEKDFQQLELIRGMVNAFFLRTQIVSCPTVRSDTGLALSSRNLLLSPEEQKKAALLYQVLQSAPSPRDARKRLENEGFEVDYVEDHFQRRLATAKLGTVRLIDNVRK